MTRIIEASVSIDRLEGEAARRECRASQEKMPLSSTIALMQPAVEGAPGAACSDEDHPGQRFHRAIESF